MQSEPAYKGEWNLCTHVIKLFHFLCNLLSFVEKQYTVGLIVEGGGVLSLKLLQITNSADAGVQLPVRCKDLSTASPGSWQAYQQWPLWASTENISWKSLEVVFGFWKQLLIGKQKLEVTSGGFHEAFWGTRMPCKLSMTLLEWPPEAANKSLQCIGEPLVHRLLKLWMIETLGSINIIDKNAAH